MGTVRSVLSIVAASSWHIHQMNVFNDFLQGDLHEKVYMSLLEGFSSQRETSGLVCRLIKLFYGLKQVSRQRNVKLTNALVDSGFVQNNLDHSLVIKRNREQIMVILAYVDDILVPGNELKLIDQTQQELHARFKIKELGILRYFLGIEFSRSAKGILIN